MPALVVSMASSPPVTSPPPAYRAIEANPPPPYRHSSNSNISRRSDNAVDAGAQLPLRPAPTHSRGARDPIDDESIYPARPVYPSFIPGTGRSSRQAFHQPPIAERVRAEDEADLSNQLDEAERQPSWYEASGLVQNFNITNLFRRSPLSYVDDEEAVPVRSSSSRSDARASGWSAPGQPYSGYFFVGLIFTFVVMGCVLGARKKAQKEGTMVQ